VLEPENNPNRSFVVDQPRPLRVLMSRFMSRAVSASRIAKKRAKAETERKTKRQPHRVDYLCVAVALFGLAHASGIANEEGCTARLCLGRANEWT
jgi:hypothetical protein